MDLAAENWRIGGELLAETFECRNAEVVGYNERTDCTGTTRQVPAWVYAEDVPPNFVEVSISVYVCPGGEREC
jgi:hypothetical protein